MPQQLPLINMLIISCKQIKRFRSQILPPIHPGKKCVLPVHQNGGQKAVFANADVHLSTNKCRVSRNLRFPWEEKSRSVLIEPDALHPEKKREKEIERRNHLEKTWCSKGKKLWRAKADAATGVPNNSFAFRLTKHWAFPGRKSASVYTHTHTHIQLDNTRERSRQGTGY